MKKVYPLLYVLIVLFCSACTHNTITCHVDFYSQIQSDPNISAVETFVLNGKMDIQPDVKGYFQTQMIHSSVPPRSSNVSGVVHDNQINFVIKSRDTESVYYVQGTLEKHINLCSGKAGGFVSDELLQHGVWGAELTHQ